MKLAKLSLAAIVVAGLATSSFAADTLAGAFKNGKVSGALQSYYFNEDDGVKSVDIITNGVDLSYKTGSFMDFSAGFTFQSAFSPWADADAKAKAGFAGDMYGSGGVLSEGYLQYANSGFFAKAGRQYISTPLVAGSGSRVTKESFEGYLAGYTGIKGLTLAGGYVTKMQTRTDGAGNIGKFTKTAKTVTPGAYTVTFDGAYTALAAYKADAFSVNAQYLNVQNVNGGSDDASVYYVDGTYNIPMDSVKVALSAQYGASSGINGFEGNKLGAKVAMTMGDLYAHVAYTTNDNTDKTLAGVGNGADWGYAGGLIYGNNYNPGVDTVGLKVGYKVAGVGLAAMYSDYSVSGGNDYNTLGAQASYSVPGVLKGLGFLVQYDTKNISGAADQSYFRFKANYKF